MNELNSEEMRDLSDSDITSGVHPDWMKEYTSENIGKFCKVKVNDEYGIFLGISEDNFDYYYKIISKRKDYIGVIYHSCCVELDFMDEVEDENLKSELEEAYENYKEVSKGMYVKVRKLTDIEDAKSFITASLNNHKKSKIKNLKKLYLSEHSPMYTQIFVIELKNIPSYVSTHFRTHKKHFIAETVTTNRIDRGGSSNAGRLTPVDMIIYCNAKTLVDMSLKRLCNNADKVAREVMQMIKDEVKKVDSDLYRFMIPQCIYRCGLCQEWKSCGYVKTSKFKSDLKSYISGFESNCIDNLLNL